MHESSLTISDQHVAHRDLARADEAGEDDETRAYGILYARDHMWKVFQAHFSRHAKCQQLCFRRKKRNATHALPESIGIEPNRECYIVCPECHKDITL